MAHLRNTEARQAGGGKDARPSKSAVSGSALPGAGVGVVSAQQMFCCQETKEP